MKGFGVLAVLWASVILGLMGMSLATTVRTDVEATANLVDGERGYFLARAGIEAAILHLTSLSPEPEKEFGRRWLDFELETGAARVEILPGTAQLNANSATPEILARLLEQLGLRRGEAETLALAIDTARKPPAGRPFASIEELLAVPGVTTELFYGNYRHPGLRELLSVRPGSGVAVNPNYAHRDLLAVFGVESLADARERAPISKLPEVDAARYLTLADTGVITLTAHGRAKGAEMERVVRAVIEKDATRQGGYRLLEWSERP